MKATVLVVTYNHEAYIAKALDSVLAQRCDDPFEILVSEDRSTDRTRDIVLDYAARHSGRIRTILSDTNVRSNEVVARGLRAARGEYVAILDGDDYWLSPDKLAVQIRHLDANLNAAVCCAQAYLTGPAPDAPLGPLYTHPIEKPRLSFADLLGGYAFATCTAVLRRDAVADIPDWYAGFFPITDWPLFLYALRSGATLDYLPEPLGVYRLHEGGHFSALRPDRKLDMIAGFYRRLDAAFGPGLHAAVRDANFRFFMDWALRLADGREPARAIGAVRRAIALGAPPATWTVIDMARVAARLVLPRGRTPSEVRS
jgi:glycosyltransferase involved in cell wall biosynthesis